MGLSIKQKIDEDPADSLGLIQILLPKKASMKKIIKRYERRKEYLPKQEAHS